MAVTLAACSSDTELRPFSSDSCSLFPDKSLITRKNWCKCCFNHDLAYWRGGTEEQRTLADSELRDCVLRQTGNNALAQMMYQGVRAGGSPYFMNWYRWGYGWSFDRKYQALTPAEHQRADELIEQYRASDPVPEPACPVNGMGA